MRPMTEDRAVREEPRLERSIRLDFIGDWGQANFHRICSWLCQEVCDRAGNRSRVAIWNTVGGGADAPIAVFDGEVNLCIATPAHILPSALKGEGVFQGRALSSLRALAVLPQTDRMANSQLSKETTGFLWRIARIAAGAQGTTPKPICPAVDADMARRRRPLCRADRRAASRG